LREAGSARETEVPQAGKSYAATVRHFTPGRYRWRTHLRRKLPVFLGPDKGQADCGNHEWYNDDGGVEHCYHCHVGERPYSLEHFSERPSP
jgi:hypothetical protein